VALWNVDGEGVGRYDLKNIAKMGCNTIKMYNWSAPSPHYWQRNHINFLKMAAQLRLKVIVPISNFFTGTAYSNRAAASAGAVPANPAGPAPDSNLETLIKAIVNEVYQGGDPGPAIMWAIGNEYDNENLGAYGYCEAVDIATIASYIIAAETSLGISADKVLAFTSPVTTAMQPMNTSIPTAAPYNTLMGGCAIEALLKALTPAARERFVASVNSYQIGQQLVDYNTAFPEVFPLLRYFYGELGWSEANGAQSIHVHDQFSHVRKLATGGAPFYGACCFEYTDEAWKGGSEAEFGLSTLVISGKTSREGNHPPVWGASYPVDDLRHRPAYGALESAIKGQ